MNDAPNVDTTDPIRLRLALSRAESGAQRPISGLRRVSRRVRRVLPVIFGARETTCTIFTGRTLRVVVPEIVGDQLCSSGFIEADVTRVVLDTLSPGTVFFDVGAQYGYFSVLAADLVGSDGAVVAFEPGRDGFRLLSENLRSCTNARVENLAVGNECATVTLQDFGVRNSALNTIRSSARVPPPERGRLRARPYSVRATTLDDYVARSGLVPDVVKIDVEGAELEVLRGMTDLLRDAAPLVSLETGDYAGMDSPATIESIDHLDRLGYDCLEYRGGLQPHSRRASYDYGNLFFVKRPPVSDSRASGGA
jgi:FkbM family methyltransferase